MCIFTALYLDNYWVRNENTSDLDMGRRPELKSEVFFMGSRRQLPITAPFHGKVSIFTALYLDNYRVRNEKTSDLDMGRRPELKSEVFFMRTQ